MDNSTNQNTNQYQIEQTDLNEIIKNIYLGNRNASLNKPLLQSLGVKWIVSSGIQLKQPFPQTFTYLHLPIRDSVREDISQYFLQAYQFIDNAYIQNHVIFIHCAYGVSRSSTLLIAYLMKKLNIDYQQAFNFVRSKRPVVNPNKNFKLQLQSWEQTLKKQKAK